MKPVKYILKDKKLKMEKKTTGNKKCKKEK